VTYTGFRARWTRSVPVWRYGKVNNARTVADWQATSRFVDLGGRVHYADFGGSPDGPKVVLVHGLGGSHLNWCRLAPLLVPHARVVALDLAGFGLTNPEGRATTVAANTQLLHRFLTEVIGEPVVLMGNSMGGMISILQAADHPETVTGLVLIDPALPQAATLPDPLVAATFAAYSIPFFGPWYLGRSRARMPAREQIMRVYRLCCHDPSTLPEELVSAAAGLLEQRATVPGLDAAFLDAARSTLLTAAKRTAYWARMRAITAPVLLLHGHSDRLVPVKAARLAAARNPRWDFEVFQRVGHVPQLEAPNRTAARILAWGQSHRATGLTGIPAPGSQPQPTS
jgi:pimeloyl-ACP methyl ester carboxylesterase